MKKVLLLNEDEAARLIIKAMLADGYKITPGGVGVSFVTAGDRIEVLVHSMEKVEEKEEDPLKTAASTAADILDSEGGVLDRGDALEEGVADEDPLQRERRVKRR